MDDVTQYLDPAALSRLQGLELTARRIVEGFVAGRHRSPFRGFSAEFAEHREYTPGDDLRYVDWKVFGRSDRYYLKQYEEETNFACWLLVDTSESMTYQGPDAAVSKLEYARMVAASLAWLVLRQQDAVGLATLERSVTRFVEASSQPSHLGPVCRVLEEADGAGQTALGPALHDLAARLRRRSVVVLISDLFDDPESLASGLKHLSFRRHDVSVLQLVDPAELDFPFEDPTRFVGLEGLPDQVTEPRSLRAAYRAEFDSFLKRVRGCCRELRIDHSLIRTDAPLDVAISRFLEQRLRRVG